jgi:hypothetical protein
MKKIHFLGIAFAFMTYLVSIPASATTSYSITFYERTGFASTNLFTDYVKSGTATFEINDAAVSPNNLVLFSDADFQAFDAIMTTTIGDGQFTLGSDDFPPREVGPQRGRHEQGILFDTSGQPLRFDTPATSGGNTADICDPSCGELNRAELTFWDEDTFDRVFLDDGTILTLDQALANGDAFTPLNGRWIFNPHNSIDQTNSNSYYLINAESISPSPVPVPNPAPVSPNPIPVPPAVWLFGSGLFGLLGMARRKSYA